MLAYLASINLLLLVFNLIPAFPLDGGRIARAIVWWRTGDRNRATRIAAGMGQVFSYLLIGLGVFMLVSWGDLVGGAWFVFIGLFLGQAARGAVYQTAVLSKIEGVKVADVMDAEPVVIPGDLTIEQALDEYFLRYRWPWFPVVDRFGHFIGLVDRERAERIPEDRHPVFTVREIMRPDEADLRVRTDDPLEALLGSEPLRRIGALMAVDADGRLRGVVTWTRCAGRCSSGVAERRPTCAAICIESRGLARARRPRHRSRPRRPARGPQRRAGRRIGGDHLQGPPGPVPFQCGPGRHQRRSQPRGLLGVARLRHGQGLRLPGRPGRDRDHVPGGARRAAPARAHGRHLPPQPGGPAGHARLRRRLGGPHLLRRRHHRPGDPARRSTSS